jgi:putative membrane protein
MNPELRATLLSWDLRLEVIIVLALAGFLYSLGWWRLRKRSRVHQNRNRWRAGAAWRPVLYISAILLLAIALMSPIDVLGGQLLTMHMVQHLLLVMIVPPLLLLANPLPFLLWGSPYEVRTGVSRLLSPNAKFRYYLRRTTGPGLVWLMFVIVYWGWHDPNAYNLALQSDFVHDLEHLTFFLVSMLFWWHVIGAGPRIHRPLSPAGRFVYVLTAIPPNMLAGLAIVFATGPIYSYYEAMPRIWGLSVMEDQQIGGVIMWVPGSMMYIIAALILASRWLQEEERKPALPHSEWATDEAMAAPGLKH